MLNTCFDPNNLMISCCDSEERIASSIESRARNNEETVDPRTPETHSRTAKGATPSEPRTKSVPQPQVMSTAAVNPTLQYTTRFKAAKRLDCSPQTLDKMIRKHNLPVFHLGRKVLLDFDELLRRLHAGGLR